MKALVLSGGSGSRLRPLTYSMPKQLIPIANKPVLHHVLDNVRDLGVTETGIVVGDRAAEIEAAVGDGARHGMRVTYLHQDRPLGLAHCVRLARDFLAGEDFVLYLGDTMLPGGVAGVGADFRASRPAARVVVHRVPDPRAFGVAELGTGGRVLRLVEKPRWPRSELAVIGVYFFTAAVHDAAAAIGPSARGELEITDAIQWLVDRGADVRASEYTGYWRDTGQVEDVLDCNRHQLRELRGEIAGEVDATSRLDGPVVLGAGARVLRSRIQGPVIVGPGTTIEDSDIGPDVSVGRDCLLRATRLGDSIVMDGASISHVQGLRGSLIGRSASVGSGEPHHRLVIGDHTRVEMAA